MANTNATDFGMSDLVYSAMLLNCHFSFYKFYLFLERREGREKERERNINVWDMSCLSHAPKCGPVLQSRHVPWLGIELATLWFTASCSIPWATPTRAKLSFLIIYIFKFFYIKKYYLQIMTTFFSPVPTCMPLINSFCLTGQLQYMLNSSGGRGHPCLVLF